MDRRCEHGRATKPQVQRRILGTLRGWQGTVGRGASASEVPMDDGPILEKLIEKVIAEKWVGWGPSVVERLTDEVTRLVAECVSRSVQEVSAALQESGDRSRYLLVKLLSRTSHAVVFVAVDRRLARRVAIKIHSNSRDHATQRAIAEAQLMAKLSHPNIVEIHDMGEHSSVAVSLDQETGQRTAVRLDWMYCVMEMCDTDLEKWCRESAREWPRVLDLLIQAARGLAYLHERRYIHGDIKPSNILIKGGIAKLSDFGFSKKHGTRPFERPGTAGFTSPEVSERGVSVAGDGFAFAVTAWFCLYGELPYPIPPGADHKAAYTAVALQALEHRIVNPIATPSGLPASFRLVLEQALHPKPEERPGLDVLIDAMVAARDRHQTRHQRRRRVPVRVAGAIAVLVAGFTVGANRYGGRGDGSLHDAALGNIEPLTRAELAAAAGDGQAVIAELNRVYSQAPEMSVAELDRAIARTARIAEVLEPTSPDHAAMARLLARHFQRIQRER